MNLKYSRLGKKNGNEISFLLEGSNIFEQNGLVRMEE